MTAPAIPDVIEQALDASRDWNRFDPGMVLYEMYGQTWQKWPCSSDTCPGEPSEMAAVWATFEAESAIFDEAFQTLIHRTAQEILERVLAAHPDAPRVTGGAA